MNYKSILFFLGINLLLISLLSVLNILYSIYFDFFIDLNSYLITFSISIFFGLGFCYVGKHHRKDISLIDQISVILLSYLILPLLIAIPYFLSIYNVSFLNSFFESVSGFTTTGFSTIKNINKIDEPLLLWRSSSQWLGGLIFLLACIGTIGSKQIKIKPAYLVSGGASGRNFYNNFNYNFMKISLIYFFSTIVIIFLLSITSIRLLDAFNLAFTAISSGGFIPTDELSNILNNNTKTIIFSFALLFPIFNFFLLFDIITQKFSIKNYKEDFHLFIFIIILTIFLYFFILSDDDISNVFLAIVSSISTSGVSVYSPDLNLSLFFLLLTIVGGALISTSSGLKYTRFYILLKISYQEIYRFVKPINVIDKNLFNSESKIDDQDVKIAFLVFISFIVLLFVLSSILTLDNLSFDDSFKLSILTLTNTTTSPLYGFDNLYFNDLNSFSKVSLIVFMIFGKIEIITVIYLIKRFIFRG